MNALLLFQNQFILMRIFSLFFILSLFFVFSCNSCEGEQPVSATTPPLTGNSLAKQNNIQNPCYNMGCVPDQDGCPCIQGPIHDGSKIGHGSQGMFATGGGLEKSVIPGSIPKKYETCFNLITSNINNAPDSVELLFKGDITMICNALSNKPSLKVSVSVSKDTIPTWFKVKSTINQNSEIKSKILVFYPQDFQPYEKDTCLASFESTLRFPAQTDSLYNVVFQILEHDGHTHIGTIHQDNGSAKQILQPSNTPKLKHKHHYRFPIQICP